MGSPQGVTRPLPGPPIRTGPAARGEVRARCGDLVVIHLRCRAWYRGRTLPERDTFRVGQLSAATRDGRVRLYRPAGALAGAPGSGRPLPAEGFERALVMSARRIDVPGALATAACHVPPGIETCPSGYDRLDQVTAALAPHLAGRPGWERLRDAARAWEAERKAALVLLDEAAGAGRDQFKGLFAVYSSAVAAANAAYRRRCEQAGAR